MRVAIIDTGIDQSHSEFEGRVIAKRGDRDPSHWHGTHVAGIIGASDDGEGITGIAPGVSLIDAPIAPHRFWYKVSMPIRLMLLIGLQILLVRILLILAWGGGLGSMIGLVWTQ